MKSLLQILSIALLINSTISAGEYCDSLIKKFTFYKNLNIDTIPTILEWDTGYVITKSNDSIFGEIKKSASTYYGGGEQFSLSMINIEIKNEQIGKKTFRADKLKSFVIGQEKYLSIKQEDYSIYAKERVIGPISIYTSEFYGVIVIPKKIFLDKTEDFIYLKTENKYYRADDRKIKDILISLTAEYKDLRQIIESKEFNKRDYLPIILLYNDYINNCN
jgi:hypothetical protein